MHLRGALLSPSLSRPPRLLLSLLVILHRTVLAKYWPMLYWNSTNPIFRIDNTDHVFTVKIRDKIDIICPYYPDWADLADPGAVLEYSEIYKVSKRWNYDNCALDQDKKLVGVCQSPREPGVPITVVFREFTPKPGGLEFQPGRSYYFISTSNGTKVGLKNQQGGMCQTKNMKLKFDVVGDNRDDLLPLPNYVSNRNDNNNHPRPDSSTNQNPPRHQSHWSGDQSHDRDVTSSYPSQNRGGWGVDKTLHPDENLGNSHSNSDPVSSQGGGSHGNGISNNNGNYNGNNDNYNGNNDNYNGNNAQNYGNPAGGDGSIQDSNHATFVITEEYYPDEQQGDKPNSCSHSSPPVWKMASVMVLSLLSSLFQS